MLERNGVKTEIYVVKCEEVAQRRSGGYRVFSPILKGTLVGSYMIPNGLKVLSSLTLMHAGSMLLFYEKIRSDAIGLLIKISKCEMPHIDMPLTIEPIKPRICHDKKFFSG